MTMRYISLLPLGSASLKVVVAVDDSLAGDPFERVGRQTLWSRRVRSAIASATGAVLEECVLHIPSENVADSSGAEVDRRWADLQEMLIRVRSGGAQGNFPELVLPADDSPETLPPMVYCSVPGEFFEIPCPSCLGPLRTCRDDSFLARFELPLYTSTSSHFLICPQCAVQSTRPTVVNPGNGLSNPPSGVVMMSALEYFQALSEAFPVKKKTKKAAACRCVKCPEQEQCWGWSKEEGDSFDVRGLGVVGTATQGPRWQVFTTHTSPFVLARPAMTPLESFVRQLGSETARSADSAGGSNDKLLFSHDSAGMDAVEVLTLRLTAFRQAVAAVREHYRLFDRAHLDINSESLVVDTEKPACGLPELWHFGVRLEATSAVDLVTLDGEIEVSVPPHDPLAPFFSPTIRDFMLTGQRIGEFKVERITAEGKKKFRIEGHLVDPRGVFPKPGAEDWVRLKWAEDPSDLGILEALARIDPRAPERVGRKDVLITTEPLALDASAVEKIQKAGGVVLPNVTYRVFPHFGPRDDLYSLGMVLLMCVLVNDAQDLGLVTDDLGLLGLENIGKNQWTQCARDQVAAHPDTWGPDAVLFDSVDRSEGRPNAIPKDLWIEVLALALRMVAPSSGMVADDESGTAVFGRVEAEVAGILRRLRALLFDRQSLNLEIQAVISELLSARAAAED
jgi:hypothetical protein